MRTYKVKIRYSPQLDKINAASASVWNECLKLKEVWDYAHGYRTGVCLEKPCELWMDKHLSKTQPLHSQSIQAVRARYFKNRKGYRELHKNGNIKAKPPHKQKKYQTTTWKKSAISIKNNMLVLSNGKGVEPLEVPLPKKFDKDTKPAIVNLVYNYGEYELHFVYHTEKPDKIPSEDVVGVDIGEIHPMVSFDGDQTTIFNGRYIRSLYRLRNKVLASFNSKIDKCLKHSKRWWWLVRRKWRRIRKVDNQIMDCLHKQTTKFVEVCQEKNIGTIVLGSLTGIRDNIDYGNRTNQKLHQWAFGKITFLIEYKAKRAGIAVKKIDESYTSQTCPNCGNRKKSTNRTYTCPCGFTYHRDGIGAINIRQKYLGCFGVPVVADMAPPIGIRLETRCCSA